MRLVVRVTSTSLAKTHPEFEGKLYRARDHPKQGELAYTAAELRKLKVVNGPICIEHDYKLGKVGRIKASRYEHPWLYITGVIDTDDTDVREEVRSGLRSGRLGELSIGFHAALGDDGVFRDKTFDEASLVARGFYEGTKIVAVCASAASGGVQMTILRSNSDILNMLRSKHAPDAARPPARPPTIDLGIFTRGASTSPPAMVAAIDGTTWSVLTSAPRAYMNEARGAHATRNDPCIYVRASSESPPPPPPPEMMSTENAAASAAAAAAAATEAQQTPETAATTTGGAAGASAMDQATDAFAAAEEQAFGASGADTDATEPEADEPEVDVSSMTAQQVANHYQNVMERAQQRAAARLQAEQKAKADLERRAADLEGFKRAKMAEYAESRKAEAAEAKAMLPGLNLSADEQESVSVMIDELSKTTDAKAMFNFISGLTSNAKAKDEALKKARNEAMAAKRRATVAVAATATANRSAARGERVRQIAGEAASGAPRPLSSHERMLSMLSKSHRYGNQSVHAEPPRIAGTGGGAAAAAVTAAAPVVDGDNDVDGDAAAAAVGNDAAALAQPAHDASADHLQREARDLVYATCTRQTTADRLYARGVAAASMFANSLSQGDELQREMFVELLRMRVGADTGVPDIRESVDESVLARANELIAQGGNA